MHYLCCGKADRRAALQTQSGRHLSRSANAICFSIFNPGQVIQATVFFTNKITVSTFKRGIRSLLLLLFGESVKTEGVSVVGDWYLSMNSVK